MKITTVPAALAATFLLAFSSCTVMQSTYQQKVDETDALAKRHAALQKEHEEQKDRLAETTRQRDKLAADLAYASGQRDKTVRDREDAARERDLERKRVSELERENARLAGENARLVQENARLAVLKEEPPRAVGPAYGGLLEKLGEEIDRGQATVSEGKGTLSVRLADSILFEPGKVEVGKRGAEVLGRVASALRGVEGRHILVEGHTDDARVAPSLRKRFPTNWELSAARAVSVARFLQQQGVDPGKLSAAAGGEWKPVGDNATPEGRAGNRRIEIHLIDGGRP